MSRTYTSAWGRHRKGPHPIFRIAAGSGRARVGQSDRPPPRVTFRLVVVSLRGPGQSPVLPFACCVGSLRSGGRCGRCSFTHNSTIAFE